MTGLKETLESRVYGPCYTCVSYEPNQTDRSSSSPKHVPGRFATRTRLLSQTVTVGVIAFEQTLDG